MRLVLAVFISTALFGATEPKANQPTPAATKKPALAAKKPAPAPAAKIAKPLQIPPGAVEREPGRFAYTDPQGKKWIYAKTPFGVARYEDKPADADAPKPIDPMASVKVIEEGDVVKFERPGPFGTYKWQKKQTELDDQEKAALAKSRGSAVKQESKQD